MAGITETARLIIEGGDRGFDEANIRIRRLEGSLDALKASYKAGAVTLDDYLHHSSQLQSQLDHLREAYRTAKDAVDRYGSTQQASAALAEQGEKSYLFSQQRITALSYALNDFFGVSGNLSQRLNAIANNLPMLFSGFGNIGMVLTGLVPIISMVINSWDSIKEAITGVADEWKSSLDGMKAQLAELEKKKIKVGVDLMDIETLKARIREVEEAIQAVNKLRGLQSEEEKRSADEFGKALQKTLDEDRREITGPEIARRLLAGYKEQFEALYDPMTKLRTNEKELIETNERLKKSFEERVTAGDILGAGLLTPSIKIASDQLAKVQEQIVDTRARILAPAEEGGLAETEFGRSLAEAQKGGPGQAAAQQRIADAARRARLGGLAEDIELASPADQRKQMSAERLAKDAEFLRARNEEARDKAAAEGEAIAKAEQEAIEERQRFVLDRIQAEGTLKEVAAQAFQAARDRGIKDADQYDVIYKQLYNSLREELARRGAAPSGQLVEQAAARMAGEAPQVRATPQQVALDQLKDQPRVRAFAERAAEDARRRKLEGADLVADVQEKLLDAIRDELSKDVYKKQGIEPTGESVIQASRNLAEQALGTTASKRAKQEEESIKGSGLTDAAITALARGQQQGGFADRRGRFQPMTVDQQFNAVLQQVIQSLAAHNPRMDAERVRDLATRIVTDARTQMESLQQQAIQAQLGLGPDIARALQATQGNPAAFQQQMDRMMQQAMMANNANQIAMMQPMMNAQPNLINQMNQVGLDRVINRNRQAPQEGFRSVPPSSPGPGAGNGQAEAPTALLDRTLGAVGQEQSVVAGMQQVMGRLSAQLNQVVANVQKLQRNNGQLMTRNEPRQSTALDFSGRFA